MIAFLQVNELTAFLSLHKKISLTILTMIYEEDSGVGRLSTPPFTRISKLQLFTNQLLMKRLKLLGNIYNERCKERTTRVGRADLRYSQYQHAHTGDPQTGEKL